MKDKNITIPLTPCPILPGDKPFNYYKPIVLIGSCFAQSIGLSLDKDQFQVEVNPFGIVYNPLTMALQINRLIQNIPLGEADLFFDGEIYHSPWHHGSFSDTNSERLIATANHALERGRQALLNASHLVLTWGHTTIYLEKTSQIAVANCHKRPAHQFEKATLVLPRLIAQYDLLLEALYLFNPNLTIICTVSPVRYLKDGLVNNTRSKATLHQLAAHLESKGVAYFPAYELMIDTLRDYRFFEVDMVHPTPQAIAWIYEAFIDAWLDKDADILRHEVKNITQLLNHRSLKPNTPSDREFKQKRALKINRLRAQWASLPHLFSAEAQALAHADPDVF